MKNNSVAKFGCLFLLSLFFQSQAYAQYSLEGFDLEGDLHAWHDNALGLEKSGIVFGSYQEIRRSSMDSHPFFHTDTWESGQIRYKEEVFHDIFLLYDVQKNVLVFRHPTNLKYHSQPIKPIQSQVDWFVLGGHTFRYYPHQILNIPPGFFDELYIGEQFDLIVKRTKESRAESNSITYIDSNIYAIRLGNEYHRLRRKGSLLRLFEKEQKKEIRQFIKNHGLSVNPENEQDLTKLAQYCDELLEEGNQ